MFCIFVVFFDLHVHCIIVLTRIEGAATSRHFSYYMRFANKMGAVLLVTQMGTNHNGLHSIQQYCHSKWWRSRVCSLQATPNNSSSLSFSDFVFEFCSSRPRQEMAEGECLARERERQETLIKSESQFLSSYCSYALFFPSLNAAPGGDDILTESDAVNILEELTEAQNSANLLGFMFSIKPSEVEAIQAMYQNPKERLCQIILAFLRQAEPPPTWRAIVNALRSKTVNLTALAKRVEAAHFPDPTASRDPPTTTSGESVTDVSNTVHCSLNSCSVKDVTPQLPAVSTSNQLPTTSGE